MEFTIRPLSAADAEGVNLLRRTPGCFENTLGIPSERIEDDLEFIQCLGSNDHQLVAVTADPHGCEMLIGMAGLSIFGNPRLRHSASLGIMVLPEYQGMGVGTALMAALMDLADNWLMLVRVELGVYPDNERAIRLYETFGFEREGVKRKAAIRSGQYVDEIVMGRLRQDAPC